MLRKSTPSRYFSVAAKSYKELPGFKVYPFIGSLPELMMNPVKYEDGTTVGPEDMMEFYMQHYKKYGDIAQMSIPGFPKAYGREGTFCIMNDPNDFMEVLKKQPQYPLGGVEMLTGVKKAFQTHGFPMGLLESGETWKRERLVAQSGLLGPKDAKGFFPAILESVERAIPGAIHATENERGMLDFLTRASFDMINAILLGHMTDTADPDTPCDSEDLKFINAAIKWFEENGQIMTDVTFNLKMKFYTPAIYEEFAKDTKIVLDRTMYLMNNLIDRYDKGDINEMERNSFVVNAYEKWLQDDPETRISKDALLTLGCFMIAAGVDTTSGKLLWNLIHLARNQDAQQKAFEEIRDTFVDGKMDESVIRKRSWLPYVHNCIREQHRLTPAVAMVLKAPDEDLVVRGFEIPKGMTCMFFQKAKQNDPAIVGSDVLDFNPDRWLPEAVEARKGTPAEIIDHPMMGKPFSYGARMCPGSRVAMLEIPMMLAHLILNYKIELEDPNQVFRNKVTAVTLPNPLPKFKVTKRELMHEKAN